MGHCRYASLVVVALARIPVAGSARLHPVAVDAELCADAQPGIVNCGPGNDRRPPGGGGVGKVPHDDGLNAKSPSDARVAGA